MCSGTTFQIKWWLAQCLVYLLVTLIEKFIVITILQIPFWDTVASKILPITNAKVKNVIVIVVIPFIVNVIMFWVVDNIIMSKWKKTIFKGKVKYYKKGDISSDAEEEVLLDDLLGSGEDSLVSQGHKQKANITE